MIIDRVSVWSKQSKQSVKANFWKIQERESEIKDSHGNLSPIYNVPFNFCSLPFRLHVKSYFSSGIEKNSDDVSRFHAIRSKDTKGRKQETILQEHIADRALQTREVQYHRTAISFRFIRFHEILLRVCMYFRSDSKYPPSREKPPKLRGDNKVWRLSRLMLALPAYRLRWCTQDDLPVIPVFWRRTKEEAGHRERDRIGGLRRESDDASQRQQPLVGTPPHGAHTLGVT